jgi:DNA-binding response OmpR family regulator
VDNTLRDGSGFDLCQQLRAASESASILMCSGWPEDEYWALALECGAKGYLTKPFAPDQLLSEITRLLQQQAK